MSDANHSFQANVYSGNEFTMVKQAVLRLVKNYGSLEAVSLPKLSLKDEIFFIRAEMLKFIIGRNEF